MSKTFSLAQSTEISNNGSIILEDFAFLLHPLQGPLTGFFTPFLVPLQLDMVHMGLMRLQFGQVDTKAFSVIFQLFANKSPFVFIQPCQQNLSIGRWTNRSLAIADVAFPLGPHAFQGPSHELLPAMVRRCVSPHQPC